MSNPKESADRKALHERLMRLGFVIPSVTWWWKGEDWRVKTNYPYNSWGNQEHVYLVGDVPPKYPVSTTLGAVCWGRHTIIIFSPAYVFLEVVHFWAEQHTPLKSS